MKKIIALLIILIMLFSACNKTAQSSTAESTQTTPKTTATISQSQEIFETTTNITTTAPSIDPEVNISELTIDERAKYFLDAFQKKDIIKYNTMVAGRNPDYWQSNYINSIDLDNYEINKYSDDEFGKSFKVILNISRSSVEHFTVGKSEWLLYIPDHSETSVIEKFIPFDSKISAPNSDEYLNDNYVKFADDFTVMTNIFSITNEKLISMKPTYNIIHFSVHRVSDATITVNEFCKRVENSFGITSVKEFIDNNISSESWYNKETQIISAGNCAHGGSWAINDVKSSIYDKETNQHIVIMDYYSDGAYINLAKTVKYTFKENEDGTPRLISLECTYDNGYQPYFASV